MFKNNAKLCSTISSPNKSTAKIRIHLARNHTDEAFVIVTISSTARVRSETISCIQIMTMIARHEPSVCRARFRSGQTSTLPIHSTTELLPPPRRPHKQPTVHRNEQSNPTPSEPNELNTCDETTGETPSPHSCQPGTFRIPAHTRPVRRARTAEARKCRPTETHQRRLPVFLFSPVWWTSHRVFGVVLDRFLTRWPGAVGGSFVIIAIQMSVSAKCSSEFARFFWSLLSAQSNMSRPSCCFGRASRKTSPRGSIIFA